MAAAAIGPPTFPASGIWFAVAGTLGAVIWVRLLEAFWSVEAIAGARVFTAVLYLGLFAIMALATLAAVRVAGSGNLRADLGLTFTRADIGWSIIALIGGQIARVVVASALVSVGDSDRYTGAVKGFQADKGLLAVFVLALLVGAPLFEELLFRGLLLRSLASRFSLRIALVGQALIFGFYHFNAEFGWFNLQLCLGNAALGLVFGLVATRQRSLVPGMIAHGLANAMALAVSFTI